MCVNVITKWPSGKNHVFVVVIFLLLFLMLLEKRKKKTSLSVSPRHRTSIVPQQVYIFSGLPLFGSVFQGSDLEGYLGILKQFCDDSVELKLV